MRNKQITSAIDGMTVTEMRKCLAEVRDFLSCPSGCEFHLKLLLSNGMEIWEFVQLVAMGLHKKRKIAIKKLNRVANEEGEEYV